MRAIVREGYYVSKTIKKRCILLFGVLLFIYLAENAAFFFSEISFFYTYIFQPLLWLGLAYLVRSFPGVRPAGRLRLRSYLAILAFICAVLYLMSMFAAGIWEGFGKSPYSFTPRGIIFNLLYVGSALLGGMLARSYLLAALANRHPFPVIVLVSLFLTLKGFPLDSFIRLQDPYEFIRYVGSFVLPAFSENLLTSYLVYLGGPLPGFVYQGMLLAFTWFCPILPNPGWLTKTLLGTLIPYFSLLMVQHLYLREARVVKRETLKKENPLSLALTSVASVLLIWFAVGIFPLYPSVIVTGSMEPMIKPGDVVMVEKLEGTEVREGDVIQFRLDKILVTHRVIAITEGSSRQFITKGDNNNSPDLEPVDTAQVKGRVIRVVPKVGWLTLLIRSRGSLLFT